MTTRVLLLGFFVLTLLVSPSFAESLAKGSGTLNGKTVSYEFIGERSVSVSGSSDNEHMTINATIDDTSHVIKVSPGTLAWNQKTFKLGDYKKIDILMGNGKESIKVDGKEILPKQK